MVIRIRLETVSKAKLTTAAIANSAFESEEPELILPESAAENLKLYPKFPAGTEVGDFRVAGGFSRRRV